MKLYLQLILSICFFHFLNNCTANTDSKIHRKLTFVDFVKSNGYKGESFSVETEDGYILRLDRISGAPSSPEAPGKPVVLFQHGIILCSKLFVMWEPKHSLVYLLADAGYDVWLPNTRGTTSSRKHRTLSPQDHKFWNFTLDDLATKDLPALIDFALKKTERPCLTFIGYSMGTSISYILLSEKPEYHNKISFVVSLSPVAFWHYNAAGIIKTWWANVADSMTVFLEAPDYAAELLGHNPLSENIFDHFCTEDTTLCTILLHKIFTSAEYSGMRPKEFKFLGEYFPCGISLKIFQHYRQMMDTGLFRKYDYGSAEKNIEVYGQREPPNYDLQKITNKIALIWTHNDIFANKLNVDLLAEKLPNVVAFEPVRSTHFLHGNFIYHKNAKALIYDRIIDLINYYHKCPMKNNIYY